MSTALAERPSQDLSPAAKQKQRLDAFMRAVEQRADQVETLLSDSGIDPKLFLETCRRSLMRDPELVNCTPASFIQAAMNCAADGLIPDGRKAAIVRYKGAAQYIPMYQGLLDIAYRSGNFKSIESRVVYEGDEFDFALGDKPFIHHKPTLESDSTKIRGAYTIAQTTNGGIFREVMGKRELDKVRAVSKAANGPNKDWPGEMARKAPVRRLWKYLPRTAAMDRVAAHDDETYDQTALPVVDTPKLAPGFSPALTGPKDDPPRSIDEILDGDAVPDHDPETGEIVDAEVEAQEAAQTAEFTDEADTPATTETLTSGDPEPATAPSEPEPTAGLASDFDHVEWSGAFVRNLEQLDTAEEVDKAWEEAKTKGFVFKVKANSPNLAKQVADACTARVAAIKAAAEGSAG